jgi:hypothetical protein
MRRPDLYSAEYYDDLRGQLQGLAIWVEERLSSVDLAQVHEFIDVGEYGLTLEFLADAVAEQGMAVPNDERRDMLVVARVMEMEDDVAALLDAQPPAG